MAKLTIDLPIAERKALFKLARQEEREPRAQLRLILRRELEHAGLLAAERNAEPQGVRHELAHV